MNHLDRLLTAIAAEHLGITTLETRRRDALDFHEVSVFGIKRALTAAYQAGTQPRAAAPSCHEANLAFVAWLDSCKNGFPDEALLNRAAKKARAAIAKPKGDAQ